MPLMFILLRLQVDVLAAEGGHARVPSPRAPEQRRRRLGATLDYDEKGVPGALRLSPHAYNTEAEIDLAISILSGL
jgi:selenocysteine lyase/cysteine desulfurase